MFTMDYFSRAARNLGDYFARRINREQIREINAFDVYLEFIFKILLWEDKKFTLKVFLAVNHFFWLILFLHLRFYGTLCLIALVGFLLDLMYREKIFSQYQAEYSGAFEDLKVAFYEMFIILRALRRDSPFTFAATMSVIFLTTRIVSQNISGYTLVYLLLLALFFLPLVFHLLPEQYSEQIRVTMKSLGTSRHVLAEEELIPYIFNKDFNKRDPELDSLLTDRTADSITNSLASGISGMPSYLDVAESRDELKEEDLLPQQAARGVSYTPGELSSDSDSEHREIRFDSDHFNTSSSEEDAYAKGLRFSEAPKNIASEGDGIRGMLSSVANLGTNFVANMSTNLVANMLTSAAISSRQERKQSSSDSEFEIVNSEEVND